MRRVAAIAILHDHHMLMGKRRDNGKWTQPGGHLNQGEDPREGAAREIKEETGLALDTHLFKHLETRIIKKPSGEKIEVHGFRVDLPHKPSTSMKEDPDQEVHRWQWIKTDSDFDHIADNLHVPLTDNVLLTHVLKDKPMKKHVRRFWETSKKVGARGGFLDEAKDKIINEGGQRVIQHHEKKHEKKASENSALKELGFKDVPPDSAFPKDRLDAGKKVEKEHTTKPDVAKIIAKGHLKEFPPSKDKEDYYEGLDKMESKLKKQAFWKGFLGE